MNFVLEKENNTALMHLANAGGIVFHLFCDITSTRRKLISESLSKTAKRTAEKTTPGEFLFGIEFGEEITTAKNLERAGREIGPTSSTFRNVNNFDTKRGGGKKQTTSGYQLKSHLNRQRPVRPKRETNPQKGKYYPSKREFAKKDRDRRQKRN